jgi:hypothetical protein
MFFFVSIFLPNDTPVEVTKQDEARKRTRPSAAE